MSDAADVRGAHLTAEVSDARNALLAWIDEAEGGRRFLEVHLLRVADGRYRVRHSLDVGLPVDELSRHTDPFDAREIAQTTETGAHRPLKTSPSLKRGWSFESLDGPSLYVALDYLYPACAAHWFGGRSNALRLTHWRETASRQSGIYSAVRLLPDLAVRNAVKACCGDAVCLREVAWGLDADTDAPLSSEIDEALGIATVSPGDAVVPCPEACSLFISLARSVLAIERTAPVEVPGLGKIREEEVEQLREMVLAVAGGTVERVREGDFEHPANRRRARYLATKLAGADEADR